jgi:hypothetical protein
MSPEELNLEEGNISESTSEASEEDLQRVREDMTKAKQVRGQIQDMQKQNKQFALMLSLLLQLIDDDKVLNYVFVQLIDQKIPIPAIFAQFLPFLRKRIDIATYQPLYGELREKLPQEETAVSLVARLDTVRSSSSALQQVKVQLYLPFILDYLQWMKVIDMTTLEPEKRTQLEQSIVKELST